jgi:hypothetical protein
VESSAKSASNLGSLCCVSVQPLGGCAIHIVGLLCGLREGPWCDVGWEEGSISVILFFLVADVCGACDASQAEPG